MTDQLARLIGPRSSDSGLAKRMRFHQGWWRAFVLCEDPGPHPSDTEKTICNTVFNGEQTGSNFLSERVLEAVQLALEERVENASGHVDQHRLFNNLLSSQPLSFNFFGDLKLDLVFAKDVIGSLYPGVTSVSNTVFEFAPKANYTADNSAFDVAFEVEANKGKGLIGLECKYTDSFSQKEYDKPEYREIYERSQAFNAPYGELIAPRFNQLFRNQLISESAVLNGEYSFSIAGLFCHPDDEAAFETARQFKSALRDGEKRFQVITYWDFIECVLESGPTRRRREFAMMLWARYLATQLSDHAFERVD